MKNCVLKEGICTNCGACDMCDLDHTKKCDNCGACIDSNADSRAIQVDGVLLDM